MLKSVFFLVLMSTIQVIPCQHGQIIHGPGRVVWIECSAPKTENDSVMLTNNTPDDHLKQVNYWLNPGESIKIDFEEIRKELGNELSSRQGQGLLVQGHHCKVWVERN